MQSAPAEELAEVKRGLARVRAVIAEVVEREHLFGPRLVAVSKLKSVEHIRAAYEEGQRVFGENYVQELVEKAPLLPDDIAWHMIGHVTSSNAKNLLLKVPNLSVIEAVDSTKLAKKLDDVLAAENETRKESELPPRSVRIFVQVNTSGEESKFGVEPKDAVEVCRFVQEQCLNLHLRGLMTIGKLHGDPAEDFKKLVEVRGQVSHALQIPLIDFELSMGMSGDYETALRFGATNIRIGSTIFGAREPKH
jgi:pyridoxal phosphate enzyme (YggS family)